MKNFPFLFIYLFYPISLFIFCFIFLNDIKVIPVDTVIYGQRVGDYVQLLECMDLDITWPNRHWVTFQSSTGKRGLEVCHGGSTDVGRWYYKIKCERGMQFLSQPYLDATRHDHVHEFGTVVVAIKKYVPPGSIMIFCELENNLGHIIEDFSGSLLEQLDGEVALEAVSPEERDIGLAHFVVIYRGGLVLRSKPDLDDASIITCTPRRRSLGDHSDESSSDSLSSISEPRSAKKVEFRFDSNDSVNSLNSLISSKDSSRDSSSDDDKSAKQLSVASASKVQVSHRINSDEEEVEDDVPKKRRASFPSRYSNINNSFPIERSRRRSSYRHGQHRSHRTTTPPPIFTSTAIPSPSELALPPSKSSTSNSTDSFDKSRRRRRPTQLNIAKRGIQSTDSSPRTPNTPPVAFETRRRRRRGSGRSTTSFRPGVIPCGAMIEGCEVLKPAGVDATFVKLSDGRGWVCAVRGRLLAAQAVSPPNVKEGEFWFQVTSQEPIEVVERPNPLAYATGRRMGLGMVFVSHCIVCPAGGKEGVAYAEVESPEVTGWVAFIAQQQCGGSALLIKDSGDEGDLGGTSPLRSVASPVWKEDAGLYQMLDCNGTLANLNPHPASSFVGEMIPPYAIVRVDGTLTVTPLSNTPTEIMTSPPSPTPPTSIPRSSTDLEQCVEGGEKHVEESQSQSSLVLHNVNTRDKSNIFLKLSGRPGWVPMSRKDVIRVESTPTVERGEFIYKVRSREGDSDKGVMVLHGPMVIADHINISLTSGTMVRGRVRLRPYHGMQSVVNKQIEKKQLQDQVQVQDQGVEAQELEDGPVFIGGHFGEENRPGWVVVSDTNNTYLELVSEVVRPIY